MANGLPSLPSLPLDRFCNFVWHMVTKNASSENLEKFRAQLWRPPLGEVPDARSPWSAENERGSFASLKAQLGQ